MIVTKAILLVTVSRNFEFTTVTKLDSWGHDEVLKALLQVAKLHQIGGFTVKHFLMDGEFSHLTEDLAAQGISLNATSQDEHIREVEHEIGMIKEFTREIYNMLPFDRMPVHLVVEMVYAAVFWLNRFPGSSQISDTLSPREILLRQSLDYKKHCRLEFRLHMTA
jgi:hypothetical protein